MRHESGRTLESNYTWWWRKGSLPPVETIPPTFPAASHYLADGIYIRKRNTLRGCLNTASSLTNRYLGRSDESHCHEFEQNDESWFVNGPNQRRCCFLLRSSTVWISHGSVIQHCHCSVRTAVASTINRVMHWTVTKQRKTMDLDRFCTIKRIWLCSNQTEKTKKIVRKNVLWFIIKTLLVCPC